MGEGKWGKENGGKQWGQRVKEMGVSKIGKNG